MLKAFVGNCFALSSSFEPVASGQGLSARHGGTSQLPEGGHSQGAFVREPPSTALTL